MRELGDVTIEEVRGVQVVRISGEIDASNAEGLRDQLVRSVSNQDPGLIIDVSDAGYFDSAGVQILFDAARQLKQRGQELRVVVPPESFIADVLHVVRLADEVAVDPTLDEALDALAE
jgi:anti-sigma B factor antagonist